MFARCIRETTSEALVDTTMPRSDDPASNRFDAIAGRGGMEAVWKSIALAIVGVIGLAMPVAAEDVGAAIERANAGMVEAFKAGDAAAIAGFYSETAKMLPPDATEVTGREAIQQLWQSWLDASIDRGRGERRSCLRDRRFHAAGAGREQHHGDGSRQLSGGLEARGGWRLATAGRYLERRPDGVIPGPQSLEPRRVLLVTPRLDPMVSGLRLGFLWCCATINCHCPA
jgi:hypothetical protein